MSNFLVFNISVKNVYIFFRGLDLSPYLIGKGHDNDPPPLYDLYAVVNHYGGILGGHYTSFVRCSDTKDMKKNEVGGYKSN
jgi:hypothetical protein